MIKKIFFTFLFIFTVLSIHSKPGPKIPKPKIGIEKALKIAKKLVLEEEKAVDIESFPLEEYFIFSAEYTKKFKAELYSEKSWFISFVHPVANDHIIVYRIVDSETFELVGVTQ